jgi:O-antigen ligase
MKLLFQRLEKLLLYILILSIPLQVHHTFYSITPHLAGKDSGYLHISLYFTDILFVLLLLCSMLNKQNALKLPISHGIKWLILAYFAYQLLIFGLVPRESNYSGYFLLKILQNGLVLGYFAFVSRVNMQNVIFRLFSITGLVQALIAIGQFIRQKSIGLALLWESPIGREVAGVSKTDFNGEKYIRSYGLFFHPNQLAVFLTVACATTFFLLLNSKRKAERIIYGLSYLIILTGLYLTFSRAGLLALGVSTLIVSGTYLFKAVQNENSHSYIKKVVAGVWLAIALGGILTLPMLRARTSLSDKSVTERIDFNQHGINLIQKSPIFGHGIGNMLPAIYGQRSDLEAYEMQPPHNYFIVVAAETGLLGMILIVVLFATYIKKLYLDILERGAVASHATIYLAIFSGFLITMFFDHHFYHLQQTQLLLWITLGLGFGLRKT